VASAVLDGDIVHGGGKVKLEILTSSDAQTFESIVQS